jgi:hypothetical protein
MDQFPEDQHAEESAYGVAAFFIIQSLLRELERKQVLSEPNVAFLIKDARNASLVAAGLRRHRDDEEGSKLFEDAAGVIKVYWERRVDFQNS